MIHNQDLLERLKQGNETYLTARTNPGDVSLSIRQDTFANGQAPFAIVITCSDSRVIPEAVFSCGIGELFVIRVAGNVIDNHQLGSIEYAASHLGTKLILVLGHTHCGAVTAAIRNAGDSFISFLTEDIRAAIGDETDDYKACCLNVRHSVSRIVNDLSGTEAIGPETDVLGAVYHIEDGRVDWL